MSTQLKTKQQQPESATLEQHAAALLPPELFAAINDTLGFDDKTKADEGIICIIWKGRLHIVGRQTISLKKLALTVTTVGGTIWAAIQFLLPYLAKMH